MVITSVFQSGNSQAVRIPKSMRLRSKRASIRLEGDSLIITEVAETLEDFMHNVANSAPWDGMPEPADNAPEAVESW
ncbi:AbrB/MazE/SpoVT family DNA-binding domain-containing protein [Trueperella pyogenes]|uniref:AbrB/MazE/SpoVT family DNA-binding domain-containing protein n=1 Tax=Trueperella pyogenes TaxID=1661 RepID=A0A380MBQ1_9ACTO|nr:AbrB/MazE/SpoVT family DNA-binding domain-containing protein [Trueperella pyogenes]AWG03604.1 AbrB/MazE/SpoVT family DNA-binding domain-containing protein [Trueperella pyogenes]AWG16335.1 AbrB/MazE/SpoVT family DNA-binding domain-containing protein [Trueperella pyogenes]AZR05215.1 AbrB/MazE/SpoVT family DNA-binding domain-containing protein [Trueperella pyogenes]AZR07154.1 AbrB/MazE/SpoVT family DNA-binding domain-containing protein [Trueperella pyogenes]MBB3025755.1 antitoxin VapB [Trueper